MIVSSSYRDTPGTKVGNDKITNGHNTKKTNGKPNEQLFLKRWPLSLIYSKVHGKLKS